MIRCPSLFRSGLLLAIGVATAAGEPTIPAGTTLQPLKLAKGATLEQPRWLAPDDQGGLVVVAGAAAVPVAPGEPPPWLTADLGSITPADRETLLKQWRDKLPGQPSPQFRRLTDADGDGVFEVATIATTALKPPPEGISAAVFSQGGHLYLGCTPGAWLLPAAAGGKSAPPQPVLTGMGIRLATRQHGLRGFALGPDGRLYGTTGDQGLHFTTAAGQLRSLPDQGCAFRMELDGSGFEIFHRGLRQPCGVAFDAAGNPFTIDAGAGRDEPARLIYLVDEGDSGWRMEYQALVDSARPQPWQAERLWETAARAGGAYVIPPVAHLPGNPVALVGHPGTGLVEAEAGRLLVCDARPDPAAAGILSLGVVPDGAGMKLADSHPLVTGLTASDAQFSWQGGLLIADTAGNRILRLDAGPQGWRADAAAEAAAAIRENLDGWDSARLAKLLKHPDLRLRIRAQIALTRKTDALTVFKTLIQSGSPVERLHAIWGTGILARCGRGLPQVAVDGFGALPDQRLQISASQLLVPLLKHAEAEVRAQAAKAIGEALNRFAQAPDPSRIGNPGNGETFVRAEELPLAAMLGDADPRVRYFAALAIGKLRAAGFYGPVCAMLAANKSGDPYLRHAGAFALRHITTTPVMLTGLERHPSAAVRMGAAIALRRMAIPDAAAFINDPDPAVAEESVRAVTDLDLPENREVVAYLLDAPAARAWSPFLWRRLVHNAYRMGTTANALRLLKLVGRPEIPEEIQREVLRLGGEWAAPAPVHPLTGRWAPLPKRAPEEFKPALAAELPRLLQVAEPLRTEVTKLAAVYQSKPPAPAPPKSGADGKTTPPSGKPR